MSLIAKFQLTLDVKLLKSVRMPIFFGTQFLEISVTIWHFFDKSA